MAPPNLKQAPREWYRETYETEMDVEKETGKRETEKRVKDREEREWPRKYRI